MLLPGIWQWDICIVVTVKYLASWSTVQDFTGSWMIWNVICGNVRAVTWKSVSLLFACNVWGSASWYLPYFVGMLAILILNCPASGTACFVWNKRCRLETVDCVNFWICFSVLLLSGNGYRSTARMNAVELTYGLDDSERSEQIKCHKHGQAGEILSAYQSVLYVIMLYVLCKLYI